MLNISVCVYMRAGGCVRVHAYVYVCGCMGMVVCLRVCNLILGAAMLLFAVSGSTIFFDIIS